MKNLEVDEHINKHRRKWSIKKKHNDGDHLRNEPKKGHDASLSHWMLPWGASSNLN